MTRTRRGLAALAAGALLATALPATALAHPGAPHDEPGAQAALDWDSYQKVTITKEVGEPIDMAVMPDLTVLHTARNGDVRRTDPTTGVTEVVNRVDVYANSEDGLQTVTLDPDFETNGWVYLYYAPRVMTAPYPETTPTGSAPNSLPAGADESYWDQWKGYNQLTRVRWDAGAGALDMSTEQVIIKVEVQRGQCCHVGGDVAFDAQGLLYLGTGDNTPAGTPGANGFAPNNDAPGMNPGFDARRGAGSTDDLRGAILRIDVQEDGSYTVPEGNLFAPGTEGTRPELFVMGVRNPFRLDLDPETGALVWGDYGPDSGTSSAERGPMGYVEWQSTTRPLNGGWPYCHGPNADYNDWDFATATPGAFFDCEAGAQNTSRWNTGLDVLPPATAPQLWYGDVSTDQPWPELTDLEAAGGQAPMGGPVYRFDEASTSATKFPEYWDGKAFLYEFSQDYIAALTVPDPDGEVTHIEHVLPNAALRDNLQAITDSPIDIEFGPDGSMYVLDYGNGFFRQNPEAGLYRVDYAPGNKAPNAVVTADTISSSQAPLTVTFDGSGSTDPEGDALAYEWDFDGDGTFDATGATATHTFTELGQYQVGLRVSDPSGKFGVTAFAVTVGNVAPTLSVDYPADGSFFAWGDKVPFRFSVDDPEDGTTPDCTRLRWTLGLGHADHAHPEVLGSGCQGAWATSPDAPEHGATEKLFTVVVAGYTDAGSGGIPAARGEVSLVLKPFTQEAEHADVLSGVEVVADSTAGASAKVTSFDAGDHLAYRPVNFTGIDGVEVRASGQGQLALRWGAPDAEPFATVDVASGSWATVAGDVTAFPQGSGTAYVTSTGGVEVDTLEFLGDGAADVTAPVVTATTTPAPGAGGWHTSGPVSVQLGATDDGALTAVEYSVDGGTTWTNVRNARTGALAPFAVTAEGTTTVLYRATDSAGNVSATGTLAVSLDTADPALVVGGLAAGESHGSSGSLLLDVTATDAGSGVASVRTTVDGDPVEGGRIDLWDLSLGRHQVVVTATDTAGRSTTWAATFTVTTSYDDVLANLARLSREGQVSTRELAQVRSSVSLAERHEAGGRDARAAEALGRALERTDDELLVRDIEELVRDLRCSSRCLSPDQISIQMFSYSSWVREVGIETVLGELEDIGFQNIEPFGGSYGGRDAQTWSALLDSYGLQQPTSHGSVAADGFGTTLEFSRAVGQQFVGSGGFPAPSIARDGSSTYADVVATAAAMDALGEQSVAAGTGKLFGHNHQWEFTTMVTNPETGETTTAWEALVPLTDPELVTFQLDVLWAADAGADPVRLLETYGDRIGLLHVKDGLLNGAERAIPTDVGEGEIDWAPILDAAEGTVAYYVIERDGAPATPEFARDSFEFLTSFSY
ncbi:PQQ-dependent sugar dehydrogenase [Aquipuribacter hungaricus]|uniref:PQQ-dependent sugar dehydrogenase n=1 Tax=Aquipuribacter hungaricus TaxID=545624 RepID=A0ABV7WIA3_9MICO